MASGGSCPDCGSSNVVDDALYSQSQLVCADCGSVLSEGLLTTTRSEEQYSTEVRYSESTAVEKQPSRNQIKGLQRVRTLCRVLSLPPRVEDFAQALFKQAYTHPAFLHVSLEKKELLAGCCVLVSCRQQDWPVTMGTISSLLQADPTLMGKVYMEMMNVLNLQTPSVSLTDLVQGHCNSFQLSSHAIPEQLRESATQLSDWAVKLVELAGEAWLSTGRRPVPILTAATYLAWLSLRPCPARHRISLSKFCKLAGVPLPPPAVKRVSELRHTLCRLGKELPWLNGSQLDSRTVVNHGKDILKYRQILLRKAMQSHDAEHQPGAVPGTTAIENRPAGGNSLETGETTTTLDLGQDPGAPVCVPVQLEAARAVDPRQQHEGASQPDAGECSQGQPNLIMGTVTQRDSEGAKGTGTSGVGTLGAEKRHTPVFLPPCLMNPKKRRRTEGEVAGAGQQVTGYEEILDSEIEEYIRTPEEVLAFAEAQARLG
ncbi:transcription factor IIIB 50 kDa subunit [Lepisosteus oculatus]|uniref:transcription factor IIIB 50 kDa subunit n=1 Tax=Lepisosteus oculatus TaxID=7918 RepID=UPI0035F52934